jgi:hypothetical protein
MDHFGLADGLRVDPVPGSKWDGRFWGWFGHYKKRIFRHLKNDGFLQVLKIG